MEQLKRKDANTRLKKAVKSGNQQAVAAVIDNADANITDKHGNPILLHAVLSGNSTIVNLLTTHQADVDWYGPVYKVSNPDSATICAKGAKLESEIFRTENYSLLMIAVQMGYYSIAIELIRKNANVERSDERGHTAFDYIQINTDTVDLAVAMINACQDVITKKTWIQDTCEWARHAGRPEIFVTLIQQERQPELLLAEMILKDIIFYKSISSTMGHELPDASYEALQQVIHAMQTCKNSCYDIEEKYDDTPEESFYKSVKTKLTEYDCMRLSLDDNDFLTIPSGIRNLNKLIKKYEFYIQNDPGKICQCVREMDKVINHGEFEHYPDLYNELIKLSKNYNNTSLGIDNGRKNEYHPPAYD